MTRDQLRQQRTRARGLCIVCHGKPAPADRSVCEACNEMAKSRVRQARRSARARQSNDLEEKADRAAAQAMPLVASESYEAAFHVTEDDVARARIAEKAGNVFFASGEPLLARAWLQRAVRYYETLPNGMQGLVRSSMRLARQMWIEGETPRARVVVDRMLALVSREGDLPSYLHAYAYRAYQSALIEETDQAETILAEIAPDLPAFSVESRILYHRTLAMIASHHLEAETCFVECDRGIAVSEAAGDGYTIGTFHHEKAHRALALGYPDIASAARERAIASARRFAIGWSTRDHTIEWAYLLHQFGQSQRAADIMHEVVDASETTPELRICLAAYGIPVALATGDDALLRSTLLHDTIELSFATTEPYCIIRTARAFAQWYYETGRTKDAEAILRRALRFVNLPEYAWELLVFILVRCADRTIRESALDLALERGRPARKHVPAIDAMRQLCIALTHRDRERALAAARSALPVLREQRITAYVRAAEDIVDRYQPPAATVAAARLDPTAADEPTLTPRERQVAELVQRGLTNREIARELRIAERTVESHMTSILGRLGLRSRWQIGALMHGKPRL